MGTKNSPAKFDCYANAEPDEPMFVLLARDPMAPVLVNMWAALRQAAIEHKQKPQTDFEQVIEAKGCAEAMEIWRARNVCPRCHHQRGKADNKCPYPLCSQDI